MNRTLKIDLIVVGMILGLILSANLYIYYRQSKVIQTNYYFLPDGTTPGFENHQFIFLALEKNYHEDEIFISIVDKDGNQVDLRVLWFWQTRDGKYLHYANFSDWTTGDINATYRFFFPPRAWFSNDVRITPMGTFEWENE